MTSKKIIGLMLQNEHHWDQVAAYIEEALRQKKEAEIDLTRAADRIVEST